MVLFPTQEQNVILFVTELAITHSHSNIKIHMAAINHFSAVDGYGTNLQKFQRLYLLIRGIKRSQGDKFRKKKRDPVTPAMLRHINQELFNSSRIYEDKVMIWTAILTAFFGFLRISEYTSPYKNKYDPHSTLLYNDVKTTDDREATVMIKTSKTDPFRQGTLIRLAGNNTSLCPIRAINLFLSIHPTKTGPLFTYYQNGKYLTRRDINKVLCETTNESAIISSHSLRIGAASTAAAMGCPRWLIQSMGRWVSDCFREYIRIPQTTIEKTSRALSRCDITIHSRFDPDLM